MAACPPRDCASREGPKWLEARLFAGREAELHERVERRRVRLVHAGEGEEAVVRRALAELRLTVAALESKAPQSGEVDAACAAATGAGAAS